MLRRVMELLAGAVFIFSLLPACPAAAGLNATAEILFVASYHKGEPWTDTIIEAFEERLATYGFDYDVHYEFMDRRRVRAGDHDLHFFDLLQQKYDPATIDLIVCSGDEALDFILAHRSKFLPSVPVVFSGITDLIGASTGMGAAITGVAEGVDVPGTVSTALKLFPQARTIAFINDCPNHGVTGSRLKFLTSRFPEVSFVFIEDRSFKETLAELHRLPPDTVVIQGFYDMKKDPAVPFGRYLQMLTKSISYPVFSLWDHAVGTGVVGGKVVTAYAQGNEAGKIAVRILKGEKPEKAPVILQEADRYMFDERQLVRFGIRTQDLPDNSTILPLRHVAKREVPWGVALPGAAAGILFVSIHRYRGKRTRKAADSV